MSTIKEAASESSAPPKWLNVFMVTFLRTPLLQRMMGRSLALISFVGRRTGTRYTIPVSYEREGSSLTVLSRASRTWWRNFQDNPQVELRLAGRILEGRATANIADESDMGTLREFLEKRPIDARAYGAVADGDGRISEADLRDLLGNVAVIEIELDDP